MNNPGIAAVLSFVFSGLGQLYNGQLLKGLLTIFITASSLLVTLLGAVLIYICLMQQRLSSLLWYGVILFSIGLVFICAIGVYSIVDAYKQAKRQ